MIRLVAAALLLATPRVPPLDGPGSGPGGVLGPGTVIVLEVPEESPAERLLELGAAPNVIVRLRPAANTLTEAELAVARRLPRAQVRLVAPLLEAHLTALERAPRLEVVLDARADGLDDATARRLARLGPRRLELWLDARARDAAGDVAKLRGVRAPVVVIDFGRRAPGPAELLELRRLRGELVVRLDAGAPAEGARLARGLGIPVELDAAATAPAPALAAELRALGGPQRLAAPWDAAAEALERLGARVALRELLLSFPAPPAAQTGTRLRALVAGAGGDAR